ncbi:hypothetical protein [Mycobacteroides abscessus]
MPETTNAAKPGVYAMPLNEILLHVWYDGFTSGAATACVQFLSSEAADTKANELTQAALASADLRAVALKAIHERMQELAQQHAAAATPIPGIKPSDLKRQP